MKISTVGAIVSPNLLLLLVFAEKYDIVGRLLKPGEKPSVYPQEESTLDAGEAAGMKENGIDNETTRSFLCSKCIQRISKRFHRKKNTDFLFV